MVLLLFTDKSIVRIEECEDIVHEDGCVVCLDYYGESIDSFPERDIFGYTLDPAVIQAFEPAV